jgi:5-methylcytosine-specific restriction endonuclease McrA
VKLTKKQRETLRAKYDGRCAYCGDQLGDRWHADHLEPVRREWWKKDGGMERPENDTEANLMPSCAPCNIDKHAMPLEEWRKKLERAPEVLTRNNPTYRHALRFGLVSEMQTKVAFLFECVEAA